MRPTQFRFRCRDRCHGRVCRSCRRSCRGWRFLQYQQGPADHVDHDYNAVNLQFFTESLACRRGFLCLRVLLKPAGAAGLACATAAALDAILRTIFVLPAPVKERTVPVLPSQGADDLLRACVGISVPSLPNAPCDLPRWYLFASADLSPLAVPVNW